MVPSASLTSNYRANALASAVAHSSSSDNGLLRGRGLYDPGFEHDACGVGFVAHIKGRASHEIVRLGLEILDNLVHRGAHGCDPDTGDGAGILLQIPDAFFRDVLSFELPEPGDYGVGVVFLPQNPAARRACEIIIESVTRREGQRFLGWRDVPTDNGGIGRVAREAEPTIRQFFVARENRLGNAPDSAAFSRRLYILRKQIEREIADASGIEPGGFYIVSLSDKTVVYKGLLLPHQMRAYYADLTDERLATALALVHQRFSTNTFPSWPLAHPFRYLAHNGEINTIRGNRNWMRAREATLTSRVFGDDLPKLFPLVDMSGSDSASLDNAVELLLMGGRSLSHALMMLVPEAWTAPELAQTLPDDLRAFYEYHACLMEPWDGPAAVCFTDGIQIGATLDRNGLRPARYAVTTDDLVVLASETGVIEFAPERVVERGRLQPGRIFLVDTEEGRIVPDAEIKAAVVGTGNYADWLEGRRIDLDTLPTTRETHETDHATIRTRQKVFGYTNEDLRILIQTLAETGEEATGSMGTDTPIAVLSHLAQPLYSYFKQLFAQVTNPPIDPIRESLVMSLVNFIGDAGSILETTPENCRQIKLHSPILSNTDLEKLRGLQGQWQGFRAITLPMNFDVRKPVGSLERAVERLCRKASEMIERGYHILVLSTRNTDEDFAPIPTLLAVSAVHHHLIREGTRTSVALVAETGEAREVHHFATLLGYGASAINPYLVFETLEDQMQEGYLREMPLDQAVANYIKGINKGLLKIFSKMGISTLQSYRGAQIFEAVGLADGLVNRYFTGTPSRIGGIGIEDIERDCRTLHTHGYPGENLPGNFDLEPGGQYQWRRYGEYHAFNPDSVALMQKAVRDDSYETFQQFTASVNTSAERSSTLRGLLNFRVGLRPPVPLEEVEPSQEIVKRFATGAMSLGSISKESHEQLAQAMNSFGGRSNTGEGGEDPVRFHDNRRSRVKQVASGRFGVTTNYLVNADELQIKMAQGAKPGEGGSLAGRKVDEYIGSIRHTTPGVTLISPPPHHDIYSIEDLAQLIFDLKNVNPDARISVKLVAEVGVGTVAAGVAKAHADHILISGYEGGTGNAPLSSIKHAGLPWELGLAETQQVLVMNNLRGRVRLQADGQMKTGRDVVVAALLGAEEFGFSSAPLVAQGCIMMRVCHLNTCPVGIATQDPILRARFAGKPEHVINYFFFVANEVREIMASLGFCTIDEMVGQTQFLRADDAVRHWKARGVDLDNLLLPPVSEDGSPPVLRCVERQNHGLDGALDWQLIDTCKAALEDMRPITIKSRIRNSNRSVGTMLSGEIAKRYEARGLPDGTITIHFTGSAGQSFGAFLAPGLSLHLTGDANDYLGKGMSGGRIVVHPPHDAAFAPSENVIAGNTLLYGATNGEAFLCGTAGERFAVRNSGARAVVEGVGDHGCEYMTGGVVVILGRTGRNFAAGMSGGVAYVLDENGDFAMRVNRESVLLESLGDSDADTLKSLLAEHIRHTKSAKAQAILNDFDARVPQFVKVISAEYKRLLEARNAVE